MQSVSSAELQPALAGAPVNPGQPGGRNIGYDIGVPDIEETPTSEFSDIGKTTTSLYTDVTPISEF